MQKFRQLIPSVNSLLVFSSAAQYLSFTLAAKELGLTQPAVSHSIKQLERHLGVDLFIREHRALVLTLAGEKFYKDVVFGLGHIQQSAQAISQQSGGGNRVTLSVTTAFASHWLLPRVAQFKLQYPQIDLRFQTTTHDVDLNKAGVDLGVRHGKGEWSEYQSWHFFPEDILPVCAPGLMSGKAIKRATELLDYPLIHLDEPHRTEFSWQQWFSAAATSFSQPEDELVLNDYAIVLQAAIEGQGIALGWRYIVQRLLDNGLLVKAMEKSVETDSSFYLISPLNYPLSDHASVVRDWLLSEAKISRRGLESF